MSSLTHFTDVADRVWVAHHDWLSVNVTVVGGSRGLLLVDTHGSGRAARGVVDDLCRLGAGDVVAVVNTHEHWDHVLGNAVVREAYGPVPIHAHEWAAAHTEEAVARIKLRYADSDDPHAEEVLETPALPAERTFSSVLSLDLGDRRVELVHPGRGHTAGDLVVVVPETDVLLAGDLVEESGPPAYGSDSWPLEWPASLDVVLGLTTPRTVVVPGHGAVVDQGFVADQHAAVSAVAETIRGLAGRGVPVEAALEAAEWPFAVDVLGDAVRRGYAQLPPGARSLPLA